MKEDLVLKPWRVVHRDRQGFFVESYWRHIAAALVVADWHAGSGTPAHIEFADPSTGRVWIVYAGQAS